MFILFQRILLHTQHLIHLPAFLFAQEQVIPAIFPLGIKKLLAAGIYPRKQLLQSPKAAGQVVFRTYLDSRKRFRIGVAAQGYS